MDINYRVVKSKRKTATIEIDENCNIILRVPLRFSQKSIEDLLSRHQSWIEKHLVIQKEKLKNRVVLSNEQINALKAKAKEIIPQKVQFYAEIMDLKPIAVKITSAQKRFGSCSSKNSLCFSYILMQYSEKAIDYVVVHELAHIVHKNHSKEFYALIAKFLPDYKDRIKLLKSPIKE